VLQPVHPWKAGALIVTGIALLLLLDVVDEERVDLFGLASELVEISLIVTVSFATVLLFLRVESQEQAQQRMSSEIGLARREGTEWRARVEHLMRGLGAAIDQQFDDWGLTDAEKDVALLLLKGLSHKEVAALRGRAERTVRQQALAVYRKSNLDGRASLAAYFLEDLLLPSWEAHASTVPAAPHWSDERLVKAPDPQLGHDRPRREIQRG
jgi:DNA-binding CsgD family transcriptional regulator